VNLLLRAETTPSWRKNRRQLQMSNAASAESLRFRIGVGFASQWLLQPDAFACWLVIASQEMFLV
jgi:hypothetical protein